MANSMSKMKTTSVLTVACLCVCAFGLVLRADGVVASVTGSGHLLDPDNDRLFTVNAIKHDDGTVTGSLELNNRNLDEVIHVTVNCLSVAAPYAVIGGVVSFVGDPGFTVGEPVRVKVKDNSDGTDDQVSLVLGSLPGCPIDWIPPKPLFDVEGNITIH